MNDAGSVGSRKSRSDLYGAVKHLAKFHRAPLHKFAKRLAFNKLGRDELASVYLSNFEDGEDVGVIQSRSSARFLFEPLHSFFVVSQIGVQKLKSDLTMELHVKREINFSHPPRT